MSLFEFLELQPVVPQDDGSISELDQYNKDETFDMTGDPDGSELLEGLDRILSDFHE